MEELWKLKIIEKNSQNSGILNLVSSDPDEINTTTLAQNIADELGNLAHTSDQSKLKTAFQNASKLLKDFLEINFLTRVVCELTNIGTKESIDFVVIMEYFTNR